MSAFLVEAKTINRIVSFLNACEDPHTPHSFKALGYEPTQFEHLERLARDLYLLNCEAVDTRYGKGESAGPLGFEFQFQFEDRDTLKPAAIYKHAKCLIYQCAEGDIPERHLFKALESFAESLAHQIIETIPAYSEAQWG